MHLASKAAIQVIVGYVFFWHYLTSLAMSHHTRKAALLVMIPRNQHFRGIWDIHGINICRCVYYFEYFSKNGFRIHCFRRKLTFCSEYKDRCSVSLVIEKNFPMNWRSEFVCAEFLTFQSVRATIYLVPWHRHTAAHSSCMNSPRGDPAHGFVSLQGVLFKSDNQMLPVRQRSSARKKTEFIYEMSQKAERFYRFSADLCSLSPAQFSCLSVYVKSTRYVTLIRLRPISSKTLIRLFILILTNLMH